MPRVSSVYVAFLHWSKTGSVSGVCRKCRNKWRAIVLACLLIRGSAIECDVPRYSKLLSTANVLSSTTWRYLEGTGRVPLHGRTYYRVFNTFITFSWPGKSTSWICCGVRYLKFKSDIRLTCRSRSVISTVSLYLKAGGIQFCFLAGYNNILDRNALLWFGTFFKCHWIRHKTNHCILSALYFKTQVMS